MHPELINYPPAQRIPKLAGLGHARRSRFLLQFEKWRRQFPTLQHALQRCGMRREVYYRWRNGTVIPKETVLRRYCLLTGIDILYVMTGIAGKVGNNQLTLSYYQTQYQEAKTRHERDCAFLRLVTETSLILLEEFPTISAEIATTQESVAVLTYWVVDSIFKFEVSILPLQDGQVGFELYWVEGGNPVLACEGCCDEGSLLTVRLYMREKSREYRKKWQQGDVLTAYLKKEHAFVAKHNARY